MSEWLPNAHIVADFFHLISLMNRYCVACWRDLNPVGSKHRGIPASRSLECFPADLRLVQICSRSHVLLLKSAARCHASVNSNLTSTSHLVIFLVKQLKQWFAKIERHLLGSWHRHLRCRFHSQGPQVHSRLRQVSAREEEPTRKFRKGAFERLRQMVLIEKSLNLQLKLLIGLPQIRITIILFPILSGSQPSLAARKLG